MIDLEKIENDKLDVYKNNTNNVKLCQHAADCFSTNAQDKNIDLEVITELTGLYLNTDPDKLKIIATNQ